MKKLVAIIGCGSVGSTIAYTLYSKDICDIVLLNHNRTRAISNCYDILDSPIVTKHTIFVGDYSDLVDADIVINCAGNSSMLRSRDRFSEFENSSRIAKDIINNLNSTEFNGIFINVMNPCDEITYLFKKLNLDYTKIIGTGTLLETLRLRRIIYDEYGIVTNSYVVGNHGVSNGIIWDSDELKSMVNNDILQKVQNRVWKIYEGKGFTNFGVTTSIMLLVESILYNKTVEVCVSTLFSDVYGIHDRCISVPCVLNSSGINTVNYYKECADLIKKLF